MIQIQQLKLPTDYTRETLHKAAAGELRISVSQIEEVILRKLSIDARKKPQIQYVATVDVCVREEKKIVRRSKRAALVPEDTPKYRYPQPGDEALAHRPVIAGSGPAGLFCALLLARCGYRPIVLERGTDVDTRTKEVEAFWNTGALKQNSNVQFGEGGAGTFSDGKLNTLVKDRQGRNHFVLETFVQMGADPDILYLNKPHIGTDVLRGVVKRMRAEITRLGGEVHFSSQVTDLKITDGSVRAVQINGDEWIDCSVFVAAIGHSARDTFEMLAAKPLLITPKAFAVGVRIEHPQAMINESQYGTSKDLHLPAADYKLTGKLSNGRGIYSFCMCPGGYVVNASSEEGRTAVNGMSYRARDARNANSAMIVTVTPEDFGTADALGGVAFQRKLEACAYRCGEGSVPVQLFGDFCKNRESRELGDVLPCIKGAYALTNLREALPKFLGDSLAEGIASFEGKIRGFSRADAVIAGVESRTSSPVRITRGEDFTASVKGFYPCGEGAGYAGGITSAAMDGMKVAEAVIRRYRKF